MNSMKYSEKVKEVVKKWKKASCLSVKIAEWLQSNVQAQYRA